MTTFDYSALADTAVRLLERFGRDVTVRSVTVGAYDTATGAAATTSADTTRRGALFDFNAGETQVGGSLVQAGDKKLLLEPSGGKPSIEDHVLVGGVDYIVKGVAETNPAGTAVLYTLLLRS